MDTKAVLFDLDGTLVDSNDFHVKAWDEAFQRSGFTINEQAIHDQIGKGADMLVPALIPNADGEMTEKLGDLHGEIFKTKYLEQVRPFPQAHELMKLVHNSGQAVALASSASKAELEHYLDLLEARGLVSVTTSIDDVENSKPAPDIFAVALKKLAPLKAEDVIVVGDTPYDIEAAKKCGISAIAVRSGKFPVEDLQRAGAVAIYDDVAALCNEYEASLLGDSPEDR